MGFPGPPNTTSGSAVALGDIDGDGKVDLAVTSPWSATVGVLLNTGAGTFGARVEYGIGNDPGQVAMADLNADGRLDLVAVSANHYREDNASVPGSISVLLQKSDGTFAATADYPTGLSPSSIALGDFDGDGKIDVAVTNASSDSLSIFRNQGDGTFGTKKDVVVGSRPTSVAAADFDGDGDVDLAAVNTFGNTISVLLNAGDGTFAPKVDYETGSGPASLVAADLNGDGTVDVAVANHESESVTIFVNAGGGILTATTRPTARFPSRIAAADIDGDGRTDLITASDTGISGGHVASVLFNRGAGASSLGEHVDVQIGEGPGPMAIGEVDGDGKPDLVVPSSGAVTVLLNRKGTLSSRRAYAAGERPSGVVATDLDGDGKPDLIVANGVTTVSVKVNQGNGLFTEAKYAAGRSTHAVAVGDLDGDGDPDVVVVNRDGESTINGKNVINVLLNKGGAKFAANVEYAVNPFPVSAAIGDLDGDGDRDLAVVHETSLSVLLNNGNGTFAPKVDYATSGASSSVSIIDIDGDGDLDALVGGDGVDSFRNEGDGSFSAKVRYAVGSFATSLNVGDFNGDGRLDIAVTTNDSVGVLVNHGDGTFAAPVHYAANSTPSEITSGDLNGDGRPDLVVANRADGPQTVGVFMNAGDGRFADVAMYASGSAPWSVAIADFDADGRADIAVTNAGAREVSILRNTGPLCAELPDADAGPDEGVQAPSRDSGGSAASEHAASEHAGGQGCSGCTAGPSPANRPLALGSIALAMLTLRRRRRAPRLAWDHHASSFRGRREASGLGSSPAGLAREAAERSGGAPTSRGKAIARCVDQPAAPRGACGRVVQPPFGRHEPWDRVTAAPLARFMAPRRRSEATCSPSWRRGRPFRWFALEPEASRVSGKLRFLRRSFAG